MTTLSAPIDQLPGWIAELAVCTGLKAGATITFTDTAITLVPPAGGGDPTDWLDLDLALAVAATDDPIPLWPTETPAVDTPAPDPVMDVPTLTTGDDGDGTTVSLCCSGTPAASSRAATLGAARWTVLIAPPSFTCTVLGLTTGSAMPASGTRLPREAASGALSVICSWASASCTVDAVVQTCSVPPPSVEISKGRLRRSTIVSVCATGVSAAGYRSSRSSTSKPFSLTTSMTRDFIVATVIDAPSTVSVTVLCAATAVPPANTKTSKIAATRTRSIGERAP